MHNIFEFKKFIFLNTEIITIGVIITNMVTQIIKKIFKKWYGSLVCITSAIVVSTTYLFYFILYEQYNLPRSFYSALHFSLQIIFEYIIYTFSLIICAKVGYDTLRCYLDKIVNIIKEMDEKKQND